MDKLCRDCNWCGGNGALSNCKSPKQGINRVDGSLAVETMYAHRLYPFLLDILDGRCGIRGRWWEPKAYK